MARLQHRDQEGEHCAANLVPVFPIPLNPDPSPTHPHTQQLEIATCANQDPLEATTGLKPIVGIDVWEHAYYLQYKNVRPDYVNAIWDVIDWKVAGERLEAAM